MFVTDRNLARYLGQTPCVRKCKKIGIENLTIVALKYMQNYPMTMLSCFDFLRQLISERLQGRKNENYVFNNPRIGKASLFSTAADEVNVSEGVLFRVAGRFVRNISGCERSKFERSWRRSHQPSGTGVVPSTAGGLRWGSGLRLHGHIADDVSEQGVRQQLPETIL